MIVAEDQEQVDKVLALKDKLPALRLDRLRRPARHARTTTTTGSSRSPTSRSWAGVRRPAPRLLRAPRSTRAGRRRRDHRLHLGHHRQPQGRDAHARQHDRDGRGVLEVEPRTSASDDDWLAYLPMAWVGDAFYTLVLSLVVGFTASTARRARRRCSATCASSGPTAVLAPPRIWENMLTAVQVKASRRAAAQALGLRALPARSPSGGDPARRRQAGPARAAARHALGEFFVYGPVRDQLGLRARAGPHRRRAARARHLPLLPLVRRQPQAGLRLHRDHRARLAAADAEANPNTSAGRARASRSRSPTAARCSSRARRLQGLLQERRGDAREVIDRDGWFHTGDAGFIDPRGHLVIIDRAKDVGALADGTPSRRSSSRTS